MWSELTPEVDHVQKRTKKSELRHSDTDNDPNDSHILNLMSIIDWDIFVAVECSQFPVSHSLSRWNPNEDPSNPFPLSIYSLFTSLKGEKK